MTCRNRDGMDRGGLTCREWNVCGMGRIVVMGWDGPTWSGKSERDGVGETWLGAVYRSGMVWACAGVGTSEWLDAGWDGLSE